MVEWLRLAYRRILLIFWHREMPASPSGEAAAIEVEPPPEVELFSPSPPPVAPEPKVKPDARAADIEGQGRWYFKRDILDRLDEYFQVIRKLRDVDPWAYRIYSKVGAVVVHSDGATSAADAMFDHVCSFGAVFYPRITKAARKHRNTRRWVYCSMAYYSKWSMPPPQLERCRGEVYSFNLMYLHVDMKHEGKYRPRCAEFWFEVDRKENAVRMLRQQLMWEQKLPIRSPCSRAHKGDCYAQHRAFGYNPDVNRFDFAADFTDPKFDTPAGRRWVVTRMFCHAVAVTGMAQADVRIAVSKDDLMATFSVDLLRIPYFFKDRVKVPVADGRRARPIFHIVRTHERVTGALVHSHFRGLRVFDWCGGYQVRVTMPGKHHRDLAECDIGGHDDRNPLFDRSQRYIGVGWMARRLAKVLRA